MILLLVVATQLKDQDLEITAFSRILILKVAFFVFWCMMLQDEK